MEEITLTIDGKTINCLPGTSILEAALANGIEIPRLCHHPDLESFGACRLCLVEDEKSGRAMASCVTPAAAGMIVATDSPAIKNHRRNIVRLMMAEHPESCIVCNKGNRCQLRRVAADLDVGPTDLYPMPNYRSLEQANPFIVRDLSKCILCGKCIRADHELVVVGAIDYNLRGFKARPATVLDRGLENSNCTFCGTCVSICPTGALAAKNTAYVGTPARESNSICGFCGVGCSMAMGVASHRIVETNPSDLRDTVNGATLCVRGHFAHDFLNSEKRLTGPMVRKEGELVPVLWQEALDRVAGTLGEIKKKYGPSAIGFMGSSKCTNEENYLFQKIARAYVGTNNLDNGSYVWGRPVLRRIQEMIGGGGRKAPLKDLLQAETVFVLGANPAHSAPVVSYYIKRAAKGGIPLIVADPRKTELMPFAALRLNPAPHSDSRMINAIAARLFEEGAYDASFMGRYTEGFDPYREALATLDLEESCEASGLDRSALDQAVRLLKGRKISFVVGQGVLQQKLGVETLQAVLNLSLMTGSLGSQGGGLYILQKENNQAGAWDMGTVSDCLPGRESLGDDAARKRFERAWGAKISPDPGLDLISMLKAAEKGRLKALYVFGENPLRSLPDSQRVRNALEKLAFLVVQDIIATETSEIADVVLPGAAFSEKAGSFTNMEGRIQGFRPVVPPPGKAKADWEILDLLAERLGAPKRYGSLERLRQEVVLHVPMYRDMGDADHGAWVTESGKKALFNPNGQGDLISFSTPARIGPEEPDRLHPLTAILGSLRFHLGSGTRTGLSRRIGDLQVGAHVQISPDDGVRMNLQDGDTVRVVSQSGAIEREVRIEKGLPPGLVFVPTAFDGNRAAELIPLTALGDDRSPGWKACAVTVEKL